MQSTLKISVKTLKVLFEDLQTMRVPDWIVTLFDFNVQNADIIIRSCKLNSLKCVWISRLNHSLNAKTCVAVPYKYR